jgi:hypothetical protein
MTFTNGGAMTISPDGHWMVFPAIGEDGGIGGFRCPVYVLYADLATRILSGAHS